MRSFSFARSRRWAQATALGGALALLAACSSVTYGETLTAGNANSSDGSNVSVDDLGTDFAAGSDSGSGDAGSSGANSSGGSSGIRTTATTAGRSGGATAGKAECPSALKLGVSYSSDLAAGLGSVGAGSQDTATYLANLQKSYRIGVDELNKRGGLGGCKVSVVFFDFKSLSPEGFDGQSQQECSFFADDQKVFAVYSAALESKVLIDCLAKKKIPVFFNGQEYNPNQADFTSYRGYLYQPSHIVIERWGNYIDAYNRAGYFDKGAKVAILLADDGSGNNQILVNQIWKPKLAALGINPVVYPFQVIKGVNDLSRASSQFSSAVLQFKSQGITHVMMTPDFANTTIFFTQQAESQSYRPRYATNTLSGMAGWETVPEAQRDRAVGVSFIVSDAGLNNPLADTNPATTNRKRCNDLYKPQNVTPPLGWCDVTEVLFQGMAQARSITPGELLKGVESLGTSIGIATGYAEGRFARGCYDGATSVRVLEWRESRPGWAYVSSPTPIP